MQKVWCQARSEHHIVKQIGGSETVSTTGTEHSPHFFEMRAGIGHVFQNPVPHTGVKGVIGERKTQTIEDLIADAGIIVQNLRIDIHSGTLTALTVRLDNLVDRV